MKNIVLILLAIILFTACQKQSEQRYFPESEEINTLKAGIDAYESGDWKTWRSHFADTAKIYVNSKDAISINERMKALQESTIVFSSYGFDREKEYTEMVLDKDNETWVYYWATHNGKLAANEKEIIFPVHLAVQFVDGKIVEEHIYFDGTAMNKEIEALIAEAAAAEDTTIN